MLVFTCTYIDKLFSSFRTIFKTLMRLQTFISQPNDSQKSNPIYENLSQLIGSPNAFHFWKFLSSCAFHD